MYEFDEQVPAVSPGLMAQFDEIIGHAAAAPQRRKQHRTGSGFGDPRSALERSLMCLEGLALERAAATVLELEGHYKVLPAGLGFTPSRQALIAARENVENPSMMPELPSRAQQTVVRPDLAAVAPEGALILAEIKRDARQWISRDLVEMRYKLDAAARVADHVLAPLGHTQLSSALAVVLDCSDTDRRGFAMGLDAFGEAIGSPYFADKMRFFRDRFAAFARAELAALDLRATRQFPIKLRGK